MADLIRMTEATALGLHTMVVVARDEAPTPMSRVAAELQASEAHLSKVLQQLVRAGLLASKRGPGGGYALLRPAAEVRLLDVYEALEGPIRSDGCLFDEPVCRQARCVLGDLVERLRSEARDHLATTSLQDVADVERR